MREVFGLNLNKEDLLRRLGDIRQVAGAERFVFREGSAAGVEAVLVRTGGGLEYMVLPGRGMDIGAASYQGVPLAWVSPTGPVHASYYDPRGVRWLRSFHGGLLTGCGLTQAGPPGDDRGETLGLHGRLSNIPAEAVAVDGEWRDDDYSITVKGKVRESAVFGEYLTLARTIESAFGGRSIVIEDEVKNEGWRTCPHMMIYHINLGFPLLDGGALVALPSAGVTPRNEDAAAGLGEWMKIPGPIKGFREQVFFHELTGDDRGGTWAALINKRLGLGLSIHFNLNDLPHFIQWKMPGDGEYVLGLEPANCLLGGRAGEREAGRLRMLEPGQTVKHQLEIRVLAGRELDSVIGHVQHG